tara:strand:+ start:22229 stop:25144 length:2916 start_codon:yes stop_codon:yes gene_type:complete
MRTVLTNILLLLSFGAQAAPVLIYGASEEAKLYLKETYSASDVFQSREKDGLPQSIADSLKADLKVEEIEALKSKFKLIIESNPTQRFLSKEPYESKQWALNNDGSPLVKRITDIDTISVAGIEGEDINISKVPEDPSNKIKVAVVDSGIDPRHPEFRGKLRQSPMECKQLRRYEQCLSKNPEKQCVKDLARDMDGNGYPLDCTGWNVTDNLGVEGVEGGPSLSDSNGHGTHVASIIAAARNGVGIAGVIQNVELIPVKVGTGSSISNAMAATDKIAKAVRYAINAGAQIINLSLGWRFEQDSLLMREMIELAASKDILVVAGAGNDGHEAPVYPCSYENVICVASHTVNGELSSFSNYGAHVDVVAPGEQILGAWPTGKRSRFFTDDDNYEYLSGTSQAAPYVSGVLARMLNLGLSPSEARIKLFKGARQSAHKTVRHGNIDLQSSLKKSTSSFVGLKNKSPALINWAKDSKSFLLKLENLGKLKANARVTISKADESDVQLRTKRFEVELGPKEELSKRIYIDAQEFSNADFLFKISIDGQHETKEYFIQAKALNIVDGSGSGIAQNVSELYADKMIQDASFNLFTDHSNSGYQDILVAKKVNDNQFISLLKEDSSGHVQKSWFKLEEKSPIFLNLSKVDLNLDGTKEYVVTLMEVISSTEKVTKFKVFDDEFKPIETFIAPDNKYDNSLVAMPGKFSWIKRNKRMVPAWIGVGERPESQRPNYGIWESPKPELKINRIYTMTPEGIETIALPNEELPLHFLYNKDSSDDVVVISADSFGFYKRYSAYRVQEKVELIEKFNLTPYIDLLNTKPLPLSNAKGDNAFFYESSLNSQKLVSLELVDGKIEIKRKLVSSHNSDAVLRVLSFNGEQAIYQTKNHLGFEDSLIPSRTGARRIKHNILSNSLGLFLSDSFSPGIGAELITLDGGKLERRASGQTFATKGCSFAGLSVSDVQYFICPFKTKVVQVAR